MPAATALAPTSSPIASGAKSAIDSVAIIGGGPRGLAAAEALAAACGKTGRAMALTVIDSEGLFGAGPNYHPRQPRLNRLNIPLRAIDIACPTYPGAPPMSLSDWMERTDTGADPDHYPARALLGGYFQDRWQALVDNAPAAFAISTLAGTAVDLKREDAGWMVGTKTGLHGPFGAVLLALGHQSVADPQIDAWRRHADKTGAILLPAYPSETLCRPGFDWAGKTVAVRGLGLSTLDVIGLLTLGQGGAFDQTGDALSYRRSGREPLAMLPFSRDGMPPAPKPATAQIDALYDLDHRAQILFVGSLANIVAKDVDAPLDALCAVLLDIATPIGERLGLERAMLDHWLAVERNPKGHHPGDDRPVRAVLADQLAMAENRLPPSPGYLIGQVWRKLGTPLRKAFNPVGASPATAGAMVGFDEGLKRFSYGPPPRAVREMLALIDAGLLDLRAVEDPDIARADTGWRLSSDAGDATAGVMIDAVLPPADLARADAPLVARLRENGLLVAAGAGMGATVLADGTPIDQGGKPVEGLAVLGRMATGSVIAADSLHDCFGAAVERWAHAVAERAAHRAAEG